MPADTRTPKQALIHLGDESWASLVAEDEVRGIEILDFDDDQHPKQILTSVEVTKEARQSAREAYQGLLSEYREAVYAYNELAEAVEDRKDARYLAALVVAQCDREHGNDTVNCVPACQAARDVIR